MYWRGLRIAMQPPIGLLSRRRAMWIRGAILSHRDWVTAIVARDRLRRQWREVFRQYDVVLCPIMSTPAFPHDHSPAEGPRPIDEDGEQGDYNERAGCRGGATLTRDPQM